MHSLKTLFAASALAASLCIAASGPATAAPLAGMTNTPAAQPESVSQLPVELVQQRRYNRQRHGDRFRSRRGRHRHFYNGYWYATPWWLITMPGQVRRCDRIERNCRIRFGRGRDYRRCMRNRGCRP